MSSSARFIASITRMYSPYRMSQILSSSSQVREDRNLTHSLLGYRYLSSYGRMQNYNTHRRNFSIYNHGVQPDASLPSQPPSSSLRWILGIVLTIILPFVANKWGPLLQFKNEIDTAMETIEDIAEVVEKVAEVVDKVAEGIAGNLPEGGKLKKVLDIVEDVAEKTSEDAHIVGDAIDKFQEVEDKVENIVESLGTAGANEHPKEANDKK